MTAPDDFCRRVLDGRADLWLPHFAVSAPQSGGCRYEKVPATKAGNTPFAMQMERQTERVSIAKSSHFWSTESPEMDGFDCWAASCRLPQIWQCFAWVPTIFSSKPVLKMRIPWVVDSNYFHHLSEKGMGDVASNPPRGRDTAGSTRYEQYFMSERHSFFSM